jgi:hypothetical protein
VIDRRLRDFLEHAIGNVRGPGNLQGSVVLYASYDLCYQLPATTYQLDLVRLCRRPNAVMNVLQGTGFPWTGATVATSSFMR